MVDWRWNLRKRGQGLAHKIQRGEELTRSEWGIYYLDQGVFGLELSWFLVIFFLVGFISIFIRPAISAINLLSRVRI